MVLDSRKKRKKRMKSNYIWNKEVSTELGAGEQAVTEVMSVGDLWGPKIDQGRTGRMDQFGKAEPSASRMQVAMQRAGPL